MERSCVDSIILIMKKTSLVFLLSLLYLAAVSQTVPPYQHNQFTTNTTGIYGPMILSNVTFVGSVVGVVTNGTTGLTLSGNYGSGGTGITATFLDSVGLTTVTGVVASVVAMQPQVTNNMTQGQDISSNMIGGWLLAGPNSNVLTNMIFTYNPTNVFLTDTKFGIAGVANKLWTNGAPNSWTNFVNQTAYITNIAAYAGTSTNYQIIASGAAKWGSSNLLGSWIQFSGSAAGYTFAPLTMHTNNIIFAP